MVRGTNGLWIALGLAALMSGCSINGQLQLGDDCLQTRECAAGLICIAQSVDNRLRCDRTVDGTAPAPSDVSRVEASASPADSSSD
ncbi:MAG: hypothetical protein Q8Q09_04230 [Deltaproteobacteria bacterium]|nr:hypothetical protein [Deltaproteobacteria bacterium]